MCVCASARRIKRIVFKTTMGWLMLVGSIKLYVSFAKEPHKRDAILNVRVCVCEKEKE